MVVLPAPDGEDKINSRPRRFIGKNVMVALYIFRYSLQSTSLKDSFMMKSILITGASSGIGEELALFYAAPGVRLFLSGRDKNRLEAVAAKCRAKGGGADIAVIDVCAREAMAEWISGCGEQVGGLDLVIANAGISGGFGGQDIRDIVQDYKIFDVNLQGVLNTIYPALPQMVAKKSGQIVIISSLAGFVPMPSAPAYSASKAAVRFYGEALAAKLKPYHIAVTVICPGFIKSRMTDENEFPMPFLMETDKAVRYMAAAIDKRQVRVDFPVQMAMSLKLLSLLPSVVRRAVFACLPDKKHLPKTPFQDNL